MAIVDHFMAHVDRPTEQLDCPFDDVDSSIDTGTEATRIGEKDFHVLGPLRLSRNASSNSNAAPMVMQLSAMLKAGNQ